MSAMFPCLRCSVDSRLPYMKRLLYVIILAFGSTLSGAEPKPPFSWKQPSGIHDHVRSASPAGVERSEHLGFGFRREYRAEVTAASFEGLAHYAYLLYRKQEVCRVDSLSIAPSGRFAIYQESESGNLFLFRRADRKVVQLTSKHIGVPSDYVWHESDAAVEVQFNGKTKPRTFALPSPTTFADQIPPELVGVWASRGAKFTRGAINQGSTVYLSGNGSAAFIVAPPPIGAVGRATYNPKTFTLRLTFTESGKVMRTETLMYNPRAKSLTGPGPDENYTRRQSQVPLHIFKDEKFALPQDGSIRRDSVQQFHPPITLAQIERTFGPAMQGHGPYRWYRCADYKNSEVWFWLKPRIPHSEPKASAALNVIYVTLVPANDPDTQKIIWPPSATHLKAESVIQKLYHANQ